MTAQPEWARLLTACSAFFCRKILDLYALRWGRREPWLISAKANWPCSLNAVAACGTTKYSSVLSVNRSNRAALLLSQPLPALALKSTKVTIISWKRTGQKNVVYGARVIADCIQLSIMNYRQPAPLVLLREYGYRISELNAIRSLLWVQKAGLFTEQLSLSAMGLIASNLREAVNNPSNVMPHQEKA